MGYASFEGVIPRGEYGAGQVIIWDAGDYSPQEKGELFFGDRARAQELARAGLEQGKLSLLLRGYRLKGSWALVRMKRGDDWLLIKHRDDWAGANRDVLEEGASVVSDLTIDDLKAGRQPPPPPAMMLSGLPGAKPATFPATLSPMLASAASAPFSDPDWLFEPKLDGYRALALVRDSSVRLLSRRGLDITGKYPGVSAALSRQPAARLALDGEIIALDRRGKPCFQCLQGYLEAGADGQGGDTAAIIHYVFDLLYLDGFDLRSVPLAFRQRTLERVLQPTKEVRLLEHFEGDGAVIFKSAVKQGFEGVIAKRKDSRYQPGQRSADWLKIKSVQTDDFVIGGYTAGTGSRAHTLGALLLGYYDDRGRLVPAGHVGTGFDEGTLASLKKRLEGITTRHSPFATEPPTNAPATWVRPEVVVEVKFSERTRDGRLRAPVYLRLRDDKPASEARRTNAVTAGQPKPSKKKRKAGKV